MRKTLWEEQESDEVFWFGGRLSWSPDGKLLAFSDRASRGEPASIFLLSLDSLEVRRLTSPLRSRGDFNPEFSPDGQTLAFVRVSQGISQSTRFRFPEERNNVLSRIIDRSWVLRGLLTVAKLVFANGYGLWKISLRGGEPERLQFGQDGVRAFNSREPIGLCAAHANLNIWRRRLNSLVSAGPPEKFISSTRMESGPQFSPDGSKIAFESTRSGAYEIWMCRSDGSSLIQLTHFNPSEAGTPRWSPDGQQIVFDSCPCRQCRHLCHRFSGRFASQAHQ